MKSVGYLFLSICAFYCYSNGYSDLLENCAHIYRSAKTEQEIIPYIHNMCRLTTRNPDFFFYQISKKLCAITLYNSACNQNVSDIALIKETLKSCYPSTTIKKAIAYLVKKIDASDFNEGAFIKVLDGEYLNNSIIASLAQKASFYALPGITDYMLKEYPDSMLSQKIVSTALETYLYSVFIASSDRAHRWHTDKALSNLDRIHTVAYPRLINHTLLHDQVRKIEPCSMVIEWLLNHKYDPNILDSKGCTALDVLYSRVNKKGKKGVVVPSTKSIAIAGMLIQAGAVLSDVNSSKKTLENALISQGKTKAEKNNIFALYKMVVQDTTLLSYS